MRVLVIGGAGFIGSITAKTLIEEGHDVLIYDSLVKGHKFNVDLLKCPFIKGCLSDKKLLDKTFKDFRPHVVVHFAGFIEAGDSMKHPEKFFKNNFVNGIHLLDAMIANKVQKIIFSSSAAVYSQKDSELNEDDKLNPLNVYGETKLMFEKLLGWYDSIYGIKSVSLRYFNAYGNDGLFGEKHNPETHLIPLLIQAAFGKRSDINLFGVDYDTPDGTCIRDFIHVKDLARAHVISLNHLGKKSKIYNVGTGKGHSVREVINLIKKLSGREFEVIEKEKRKGDPKILIADPAKIKKELGWEPKIGFEEGLNQTINYFKEIFK